MKFLDKLSKNESRFQRFFGLSFEQLDSLVKSIKPIWSEAEKNRLERSDRVREIGGGRHYGLKSMKEKLLAVLFYYKQYPTQELLGFIVGIDQSAVSRLLQKMMPLLEQAADPELKTYLEQSKEKSKRERINNMQDFFERHPDLRDVSTDATEQQCYRSKDYETQKKYYSGKTKQHAIKTQIAVARTGRILDVSDSYPGSVHDKTIIDKEKTVEKFDKRVPHRFDSGYQGIRKNHPNHYLLSPIKKPKNGELTALEKEYNRINSKYRVVAEHAFSRAKKFRILSGVFRQQFKKHNQSFRNVAAILNFKLLYPTLAI